MGLLDSILGAVTGGSQGGALSEVMSLVQNNPQAVQAVVGMLGDGSAHGGMSGVLDKLNQAGLGDAVSSWVGNGANQQVSGDQITNALGSNAIGALAQQMGVDNNAAAGQLASLLPAVINHLTPNGQVPQGGLGSAEQLMGAFSSFLK